MGWYHATNILDGLCPSARLTDVVEPYFLGAGKGTPAVTDILIEVYGVSRGFDGLFRSLRCNTRGRAFCGVRQRLTRASTSTRLKK